VASYAVLLKPSVEKDLRPIPAAQLRRIWARIGSLSANPIPRQSIKLSCGERPYRVRAGDHKAIYRIDRDRKFAVVHYVRHRAHAYSQRELRLNLSRSELFPFDLRSPSAPASRARTSQAVYR
jgi:mRNA interferase RelE/StbE